jgi:hypothetical protein
MRIAAGSRAGVAAHKGLGRPLCGVVAAIALGLSAAACTTDGQSTVATATPRGPTVAFESIDGPPESIFQKLVQNLSEEADARQIAVVSREGPAQYRVRGYVSAQTQGKRSTISWVWDVYDADQRRALRIAGEEPASFAGRGTWAIADDQVLRRIAHAGMDRLVAFLASPNAQPEASPPAEREPALTVVSMRDDFAPESSGIFPTRAVASPAPAETSPASEPAVAAADTPAIPLPRRRPAGTSFAGPESLAYLAPSR